MANDKVEAKIEGTDNVLRMLDRRLKKAEDDARIKVVVGYEAPYAIYVHENLEAYHKPPTQAKYLEQPSRERKKEILLEIRGALKEKKDFGEALMLGGQLLLKFSREIVPYDTGYLHDSGYVRLEKS